MLRLYETKTKQLTEIKPLKPGHVSIYTCGPTVYRDAHIGNLRSYLMADWIRRALEQQGIIVTSIKNITDVGHMRQEDLDQGDDKIIAAARSEGKTAHEISSYYYNRYLKDENKLNILPAHNFPKATEHVAEMIEMISVLITKGYAYQVNGNVYFSISKFVKYGDLSGNIKKSELLEAVRVEADPLKNDPRDFTLWKAAEKGRELMWDSPWGFGFPGWHIECSAMSLKYLGSQFDIHTGGVDNIFPHHEGEIAQSEAYTGEKVVQMWVHAQHLLCDGVKMSKSLGNSFLLNNIENIGIDPRSFRYLCLTAKYNSRLNFTFTALKSAQRGILHLQNILWDLLNSCNEHDSSTYDNDSIKTQKAQWTSKFFECVNNDLNLPRALALLWKILKSPMPPAVRYELAIDFDKVLGLGLQEVMKQYKHTKEQSDLVKKRSDLRLARQFKKADEIRTILNSKGYILEDTVSIGSLPSEKSDLTRIRRGNKSEINPDPLNRISSSKEVESFLDSEDKFEFSIGIVATNYIEDLQRCIDSIQKWSNNRSIEILIINNGSSFENTNKIQKLFSDDNSVRIIHTDHLIGHAMASNIILHQSQGNTILLIDPSIEINGDIFTTINLALDNPSIGVIGPFGLRSKDLKHFHEDDAISGDMDAMQSYLFAFNRSKLKSIGLMRESFRFYRNLDIDFSFQFKALGLRILADTSFPVVRHEHRGWIDMPEKDRDDLSRKNYGRFLKKWGQRADLLISASE